MINLIEEPIKKLLEKFGAGSHKPGSGSAAALQGLVSAQLVLTVIGLTNDKKRRHYYQSILSQLGIISSEINTRIYPRLLILFQLDSEQFDATIKLRNARDTASFIKKMELDRQAKDALKLATETPIEVANLSVELADFSVFLFNSAFQSARGDSGVALNTAIAAIAGCLSIIDLNLLTLDDEDWIKKIKFSMTELKLHHQRLLAAAANSLLSLEKEVEEYQSLQKDIKNLKALKLINKKLSDSDIEDLARDVQMILWKHRNFLWKKKKPKNPRDILMPAVAAEKLLGYKVIKRETLGDFDIFGESVEIAGIIFNEKKAIGISKKFPTYIQNFTLSHELGHALLHKQTVLHRDRAIDGDRGTSRDAIEIQADKFATFFLMPKKQVEKLFQEIFLMKTFFLNEDNVFALTGGSLSSFKSKCKNLRELSKIIASAESFYGKPFKSIADVFNVSVGTMAIRLEELQLVEFEGVTTVSIS